MSMCRKNNVIDNNNMEPEDIVLVKLLPVCYLVSLVFTPLFFLAGLIPQGVLVGVAGIISWLWRQFILKPNKEE